MPQFFIALKYPHSQGKSREILRPLNLISGLWIRKSKHENIAKCAFFEIEI